MYLVSHLRHAVLYALLLPAAALAQPQAVAGTRVTLQPPAGFVAADRFSGFVHVASGSSIMITEMPAPLAELRAAFTREQMAPRGMILRSSEAQTVGGRTGVLVALSQSAAGVTYDKWVLVLGDSTASTMVTATYPQARAGELSEPMKQAVLSTRLSAGGPADPLEGLRFRIDAGPRLRMATRMGNVLLFNEGGTLPASGGADPAAPLLTAGSSFSPVDLSDLAGFSRERLLASDPVLPVRNITGGPVTIDGAEAYELFADAADGSVRQKFYQVIIPDGRHYVIIQGLVGADRAAEWTPYFQTVARSLRRTR
jgi:hypothetical protein